jgi:hypothetical protein
VKIFWGAVALSVSWVFTVMAAACPKLLLHHRNPQNKLDEEISTTTIIGSNTTMSAVITS